MGLSEQLQLDNNIDTMFGGVDDSFLTSDFKPTLKDYVIGTIGAPYWLRQKSKIIDPFLNNYVSENNVPLEYTNALRHRGGSALMSKLATPEQARILGNYKELADTLFKRESDTPIDLSNNELGRRIYFDNQNLDNKQLVDKVYQDIFENPTPPTFIDSTSWQNLWNKYYH